MIIIIYLKILAVSGWLKSSSNQLSISLNNFESSSSWSLFNCSGEQGIAQWWERLPPTNVARVQVPASTPYVGWVCCGSLPCSRGFSPGTPVFPSPQKPTFLNSNSTRNQVDEEPLCGFATSKSLFIYLFIYIFYLFIFSVAFLLRTKLPLIFLLSNSQS